MPDASQIEALGQLKAFRSLVSGRIGTGEIAAALALAGGGTGAVSAAGKAAGPSEGAQASRLALLSTLRDLQASNALHALLARLPPSLCSLPHDLLGVTVQEYSALVDAKAMAAACQAQATSTQATTGTSTATAGAAAGLSSAAAATGGPSAALTVELHEGARFFLSASPPTSRLGAACRAAVDSFVHAQVQRCASQFAERLSATGGASGTRSTAAAPSVSLSGSSPSSFAEHALLTAGAGTGVRPLLSLAL